MQTCGGDATPTVVETTSAWELSNWLSDAILTANGACVDDMVSPHVGQRVQTCRTPPKVRDEYRIQYTFLDRPDRWDAEANLYVETPLWADGVFWGAGEDVLSFKFVLYYYKSNVVNLYIIWPLFNL